MVTWLVVPVSLEAEAEGSHEITRDQCRDSLDKNPIPNNNKVGMEVEFGKMRKF